MQVKPFKAFRFDEAVVGDVGSCIAPPYDVISPSQQGPINNNSIDSRPFGFAQGRLFAGIAERRKQMIW